MAKFNEYLVNAYDDQGEALVEGGKVNALSLESAWHKAVALAFEECEPNTGMTPGAIDVSRIKAASESHG